MCHRKKHLISLLCAIHFAHTAAEKTCRASERKREREIQREKESDREREKREKAKGRENSN